MSSVRSSEKWGEIYLGNSPILKPLVMFRVEEMKTNSSMEHVIKSPVQQLLV